MEIGNVVKLKEKSLYYQMYEHDTFEIEKAWDKKHWVIRGLGPIAFLWLIVPKNEIERRKENEKESNSNLGKQTLNS